MGKCFDRTAGDLSGKQLLIMGGALFSMHFGASCLLYPVNWGKDSGQEVLTAYVAIVMTALLLPLLSYAALSKAKSSFYHMAVRVTPGLSPVFCTLTVLVMGPLYVIPRMSAASWDAIVQLTGTDAGGVFPIVLFNVLFYGLSFWFLASRKDTMDRIGKLLFPVLILIVILVIGKGLLAPISDHREPRSYPQSAVAYGLLQGYQTGDLPAALMFGLVILQGVQRAGVPEHRVNANLLRVGLVGLGMLAVTHLGHMLVGANTGGEIDLTLSALYAEVVFRLWGRLGEILFNIALIISALTTAVGLGASAAEYFDERCRGRLSYSWIALMVVGISAMVSCFGLSNIVTFAGPLLDACYPIAIVIVLYYVAAPPHNTALLRGARFAVAAAAVCGVLDIGNTYLQLLEREASWFCRLYGLLPLSGIRLSWIPASLLLFAAGVLTARKAPRRS